MLYRLISLPYTLNSKPCILLCVETTKNLHKVCLLLFLILGALHLASSLMIVNGYFLAESTLVNRTMDIPLILSGIGYGFTSLKLNLSQNNIFQKILNGIIILLSLGIISLLVYINFFLPDI